MPEALRDNPVSRAYFAALANAEQRPAAFATPKCAHCGTETIGTRLSDGTRAWCNQGCQSAWINSRAAHNRARAIAENGGLPLRA